MKASKIITLSTVILATVAVLAGTGRFGPATAMALADDPEPAQDSEDKRPPLLRFFMDRVASRLDLSEPQREEIRSLVEAEMPTLKPLVRQLLESRKRLAELNQGETFQEAETRALVEEQGRALTELLVAKERLRHRIQQVLTPDQREKAEALRERFERRAERWLDG